LQKKIVILGAGPTGIGAAYRLNELGPEWHQFFSRADLFELPVLADLRLIGK